MPRLGVECMAGSYGQELIEFLMNLTEPSPKVQLTPPGWRLIMLIGCQPGRTGVFTFGGAMVPTSVS